MCQGSLWSSHCYPLFLFAFLWFNVSYTLALYAKSLLSYSLYFYAYIRFDKTKAISFMFSMIPFVNGSQHIVLLEHCVDEIGAAYVAFTAIKKYFTSCYTNS